MKVYIELVLLDNFWADALVLFGTAKWLQTPVKRWRLWAAAGLGTGYAVLSMVRRFTWLQHPLIKVAVSFIMTLTAYGFVEKKRYAKHCGVFWLFSLLLAAGVQAYGALFGKVRAAGGMLAVSGPPLWAFLLFTWGTGALALWAQRRTRQKAMRVRHEARASVVVGQAQASRACLMDSGHSLYCPVTGLPVLFWPYDPALLSAAEDARLTHQPLRFATAAGEKQVDAVRPCTLTLVQGTQEKTIPCALVLSRELDDEALFPAEAAIGYFEEE